MEDGGFGHNTCDFSHGDTHDSCHHQSEIHSGFECGTYPSTEQISYPGDPPSYESTQTNRRPRNQLSRYIEVRSNKCRWSSKHCCAIIIISIIVIIIIIVLSVVLTVLLNKSQIPCDTPSAYGKSCSKKTSINLELLRLSRFPSGGSQYKSYSFNYNGQSNSDVITFSFDKGWTWYLDDISVIETLTNTELVDNGNFESGKLDTYCVCSGDFSPSKATTSSRHNGSYALDASNFFSATKLSQSLNTIPGRSYTITFWLNNPINQQSPLTVYMSTANHYSFTIIFPLIINTYLILI